MGVKIEKDNSISISGFSEGIGQSILSDYSDMLGVNLDLQGTISVGNKFNELSRGLSMNFSIFFEGFDYFTLDVADETLHKKPVMLTTTGTLPAPLATSTVYYLDDIAGDGKDFRFSTTLAAVGSSWVNLTTVGTGTHKFEIVSPGEVVGYTFDSCKNLYMVDAKKKLWFSTSTDDYTTFSLLSGNSVGSSGIIFYSGYILLFSGGKIDALKAINDAGDALVWNLDFLSMNMFFNTASFPNKGAVPFLSQYDNAVYFANGLLATRPNITRVAMLEENVGKKFDPTDTSTFSGVPDALELPNDNGDGEVISINEVGENLVLGTKGSTIYFWDRRSLLPSGYLNMPENYTPAIITKAGMTIAFNGYNGKVYQISSESYQELFSIPEQLFDKRYTRDNIFPSLLSIEFTDVVSYLDEILFSIRVEGDCYVMSYNFKTGNIIKKYVSSLGESLSVGGNIGRITKIIPLIKGVYGNKNILISAYKVTSPKIYIMDGLREKTIGNCHNSFRVYDNDTAYFTTGILPLGRVYSKKTTRELELSFLRPLTEGQGIKVYYRRNDISDWTLLKEVSYTSNGSIKDIKEVALITDIIDIQLKVVINGFNEAQEDGTSPIIKYIRLIP